MRRAQGCSAGEVTHNSVYEVNVVTFLYHFLERNMQLRCYQYVLYARVAMLTTYSCELE
jgi:hypothetical protein